MNSRDQINVVPCCLWFTGYSGAGKSTIASALEMQFSTMGVRPYVLDGDQLRKWLNRDLGFSAADRSENIRRVAEVAKLLVDAGQLVLVTLISPYQADRDKARNLFAAGTFIEIFVDTPFAQCEMRDVKGLYAKARRGELKNFTGIDSAYEPPAAPDIRLLTEHNTPQALAQCVTDYLLRLGVLNVPYSKSYK
jgi:bifunctional enzyme CysN/CysC